MQNPLRWQDAAKLRFSSEDEQARDGQHRLASVSSECSDRHQKVCRTQPSKGL